MYLKLEISQISTKNAADTEGSSKRTILTKVEAIPVYTCGVYKSKENKKLRFLDARKTLNLIDKGEKPPFMTAWNVRELTSLMGFYKAFFAKNIE